MERPKPAYMFYGPHTPEVRIDSLNSPYYKRAASVLQASPDGKVALLLENWRGREGLSHQIQSFIAAGMTPALGFSAALLVSEGADPESRNLDMRARDKYERMNAFSQNELMVANRLNANFPHRVELHSEEHKEETLRVLNEEGSGEKSAIAGVFTDLFSGEVERSVRTFSAVSLASASSQMRREGESLDQLAALLSRDDILSVVSHWGLFHSNGISRGLRERGFSPRSSYLFKKPGEPWVIDALGFSTRQIKDGRERVSDMFWHYAALEAAIADRVLAEPYDFAALQDAVVVARACMKPFTNALMLRSFVEDIEDSSGAALVRRIDTVLDEQRSFSRYDGDRSIPDQGIILPDYF